MTDFLRAFSPHLYIPRTNQLYASHRLLYHYALHWSLYHPGRYGGRRVGYPRLRSLSGAIESQYLRYCWKNQSFVILEPIVIVIVFVYSDVPSKHYFFFLVFFFVGFDGRDRRGIEVFEAAVQVQ